MNLTGLRKLAEAATPLSNLTYLTCLSPERILAMIDCIEEADANEYHTPAYDAARKRLEEL